MDLEDLVEVAILCDKYDTVAMVRPFIPGWVKPFLCEHNDVDCDHCEMDEMELDVPGNEEFLTVAWSFGYQNAFQILYEELARSISTNELSQCVTRQGKILEKNMPPDAIGKAYPVSIRP